MKKIKKTPENPNIVASPKPARLRRYRERLEKESRDWERSRNALFRQRVNSASERKSFRTLRTKAYYRFSKNYPSVVSPDGFRENISEKEKMSVTAKAVLTVFCIAVFIVTFTGVRVAVELSAKNPEGETAQPVISAGEGKNALFTDIEAFADKSADALAAELLQGGYDTAVIEFKSEYGYVYFDVGSFTGASADRKIDGAAEKIKELQKAGIRCLAYISCFKDSVAASALAGMEVLTSSGELFKDSSGAMWLDPYCYASSDYITGLIRAAAEIGFEGIMLDNVCFPTEFYVAAPVYLSYEEGKTKNDALIQFINEACKAAGTAELILCCDITAFAQLSSIPDEKFGGPLLSSECDAFCLDFRSGSRYTVQLRNTQLFRYIEEMPLAFILDAGNLAINELSRSKQEYVLYTLVEAQDSKAIQYAKYAGIEDVISVFPD